MTTTRELVELRRIIEKNRALGSVSIVEYHIATDIIFRAKHEKELGEESCGEELVHGDRLCEKKVLIGLDVCPSHARDELMCDTKRRTGKRGGRTFGNPVKKVVRSVFRYNLSDN